MRIRSFPRHQRTTALRKFYFGVPYYPEHWTPEDRAEDARRMAAAGVNIVRMGEFAWDLMEPRRGDFHFDLFDRTIAELGRHGIDTILCTPTATPPRWMTARNPDWFRVDAAGVARQHGGRQHCCTNNNGFRSESRRITMAMAKHFRRNAHVVGWQTDNELYCHMSECFCPACSAGFRDWLRKKYGSIDALNAAWGCAFWALTYDKFTQIDPPNMLRTPAYPNPSAELDWRQYLSDSLIEFQRQQVSILRKTQPSWWITHNGTFDHIDYWKFAGDLDFLGVDIYPGFAGIKTADMFWASYKCQETRAFGGNFVVPEQQGGPGGQRPYLHPTPQPGRMRLWAWQSIANGADAMLHFRWRTCRFGAETYWHGILDHDNIPRRRYEEFSREGAELRRLGDRILGTAVKTEAAVLIDYVQEKAFDSLPLGQPSPSNIRQAFCRQMGRMKLPFGLVHANDSLDGLKLVVIPSFPMADASWAAKLRKYVERGGVLVVTARTGIRNRDNHAYAQPVPGVLSGLCGLTLEEYGKIEPGALGIVLGTGTDRRGKGGRKSTLNTVAIPSGAMYEILKPTTAEVIAVWAGPSDRSPHAATGMPAITVNEVGTGAVLYVGTFADDTNVAAILDLAQHLAEVEPMADADDYVELVTRQGSGRELLFILNHYGQSKTVRRLPSGTDLLSGRKCKGTITVAPHDVAVIGVDT